MSVEPGQRWQFTHFGVPFTIDVTELALDGDVTHGTLVEGIGAVGDTVIAPTASVEAGERVSQRRDGFEQTPDGMRTSSYAPILSITCPRCQMTSRNPTDIDEGYCGNCHDWTTRR